MTKMHELAQTVGFFAVTTAGIVVVAGQVIAAAFVFVVLPAFVSTVNDILEEER